MWLHLLTVESARDLTADEAYDCTPARDLSRRSQLNPHEISRRYSTSWLHLRAAMYSLSALDSDTVLCLFDFQLIAPPLSISTYPA